MKKVNIKKILKLSWPFFILFLLTAIILRERMGLKLEEVDTKTADQYRKQLYELSLEDFTPAVDSGVECLLVVNTDEEQSRVFYKDMELILGDMRVKYDVCNLAENNLFDLASYERAVLTISDLSVLGEELIRLCSWVENGGHMMNTGTFSGNIYFPILGAKAGITNMNDLAYMEVYGIRVINDYMLNARNKEFSYEEPIFTALNIALTSDCTVYMEDIASGNALLWEKNYGKGRFVMMNQVLTGKINRGFLCAAYGLLGDSTVYPVINASAYYLDDFPAPVPTGDGTYITRDYGMNISSFYSNVWWPDILNLESKYGIAHTGLIIEDYSDLVSPPFVRNRDENRFTFFGNMLLNAGGELGFHGYNHMPLRTDGYDLGELDEIYEKWPSEEAMEESLKELWSFSSNLFPEEQFSVYVPPSNIMSEKGRSAVVNSVPEIRAIASTYFEGTGAYTQEFEVSEDGIVETPRITSGCLIDDYMMLAAFSELNFHFVQSHFLHPDDVLDEDRGAELGWAALYESLDNYIGYIQEAAPRLRNMTGSGMAEAVREFDLLSVKKETTTTGIAIDLGGFYREAYLMVILRGKEPEAVRGGDLERLSEERYLLHATEDRVEIDLGPVKAGGQE